MRIQRASRVLLMALVLGTLGRTEAAMAAPSCIPVSTRLCLVSGRFAVEATWQDAHTSPKPGQVISLPGTKTHAGAFRFVEPENPELVVKILDGRPNGYFWVFYAGLTTLHVTLKVTDTTTGNVKTYDSPPGKLASHADTHGFRKSASSSSAAEDWLTSVDRQAFPDDSWSKSAQASNFVADFTYSPSAPSIGNSVTFTGTSLDNPYQWCWDFGDGTEIHCFGSPQISYTYPKAGTYMVTLWVYRRVNALSVDVSKVVKPVTVSGPPPCTFVLSKNSATFGPAGGSDTVTLTATPSDCTWAAESQATFIHFTPASGIGSGPISFQVDPNSGPARAGNLVIAGQVLTITQAGPGPQCTYSVAPQSVDPVNPAGGIGSILVQTQADCPWTATTSNPFIRLSRAASRKGTGSFDYYVAANRGAVRTGAIKIRAGLVVAIPQAGFNLPSGDCQSTPTSLCLLGNRFEIRLAFRAPAVPKGVGNSVPLSQSSGYFTFFDPTNPEILLNMIDGHSVNSHFWLFYGALSNVDYVVTVTDTKTGDMKFYCNPSGTFKSVGDVSVFPSP